MDRRELTDEQKLFFKELAAHKRSRGIESGKWCVQMDTAAIVTCHELFESWIRVFGKEGAVDHLLEALSEEHHLIRARLQYEIDQRGKKHAKPKRVKRQW